MQVQVRANSALLSGGSVILLDFVLVAAISALLHAATRQRIIRDIYDRRVKLEFKNSGLQLSPLQYPVRNSWTLATSLASIGAVFVAIVAGFGLEGVTRETYLQNRVWAYAKNDFVVDFNQSQFRTKSGLTAAGVAAIVTPECLRRSPGRLEFISPVRKRAFVGQKYEEKLAVAGVKCGSEGYLREDMIIRSVPNDFTIFLAACNLGFAQKASKVEVLEGPGDNIISYELPMHGGDCPGNITIQCMGALYFGCAGYLMIEGNHLIFAGAINEDQLNGRQLVQLPQLAVTSVTGQEHGNLVLRKMVAMHYALGHGREASHLVALSFGSYRQVSVQIVLEKENVTNVGTIWWICTALLLTMLCVSLILWIIGKRFLVGRKGYIACADSRDLASMLINESLKSGRCKYNYVPGSSGTSRIWLGVEREVPHFGVSADETAGDWEEEEIGSRN